MQLPLQCERRARSEGARDVLPPYAVFLRIAAFQ